MDVVLGQGSPTFSGFGAKSHFALPLSGRDSRGRRLVTPVLDACPKTRKYAKFVVLKKPLWFSIYAFTRYINALEKALGLLQNFQRHRGILFYGSFEIVALFKFYAFLEKPYNISATSDKSFERRLINTGRIEPRSRRGLSRRGYPLKEVWLSYPGAAALPLVRSMIVVLKTC